LIVDLKSIVEGRVLSFVILKDYTLLELHPSGKNGEISNMDVEDEGSSLIAEIIGDIKTRILS
jgi:hypothetical protein